MHAGLERGLVFVVLGVWAVDALALPSSFELRQGYASGAANIAPANGGEYVYKAAAGDGRLKMPATLTATVQRQQYEFFSEQEEAALLQVKLTQQSQQEQEARALSYKQHHSHGLSALKLHWPKVIVRGNEICVPELASSESLDWKDHLACYEEPNQ